jgi:hypothetical protein
VTIQEWGCRAVVGSQCIPNFVHSKSNWHRVAGTTGHAAPLAGRDYTVPGSWLSVPQRMDERGCDAGNDLDGHGAIACPRRACLWSMPLSCVLPVRSPDARWTLAPCSAVHERRRQESVVLKVVSRAKACRLQVGRAAVRIGSYLQASADQRRFDPRFHRARRERYG